MLLSLVALLSLVYAVKHLARYGGQPVVAVLIAVGVVAGALFVRRQRTLADRCWTSAFRPPVGASGVGGARGRGCCSAGAPCCSPSTCNWSPRCRRCGPGCGCCPPPWR
ncbi:hypothetical protein NKG94_26950 [Micromonospora sp. M12]